MQKPPDNSSLLTHHDILPPFERMAWQIEDSSEDVVDMKGKGGAESDVVAVDLNVGAGDVECAGASAK